MHIGGLADRLEKPLPRRHVAVVLRDALQSAGASS
jgi:hypothetical protein